MCVGYYHLFLQEGYLFITGRMCGKSHDIVHFIYIETSNNVVDSLKYRDTIIVRLLYKGYVTGRSPKNCFPYIALIRIWSFHCK